jgi:hypothetical protein
MIILWTRTFGKHYLVRSPGISQGMFSLSLGHCIFVIGVAGPLLSSKVFAFCMKCNHEFLTRKTVVLGHLLFFIIINEVLNHASEYLYLNQRTWNVHPQVRMS